MIRVFLSYSRSDERRAVSLHRLLVGEGHEVFLDRHPRDGIMPGQDWKQRLYERLRWADTVVCLVSRSYVTSQWCFAEVVAAQMLGRLVIPVAVESGVDHPLLDAVQYIDDAAGSADSRLVAALREADAVGGAGWPDARSPFPGLRAFDARLSQAFFGRRAEVQMLAGLLRAQVDLGVGEALVVVGASGCGKSSLVSAGLGPSMGADPAWLTLAPWTPGARSGTAVDPVAELARVLARRASELGLAWTVGEVRHRLDAEVGLALCAEDLLAAAPGRRTRLLLIVDQFEELLTQAPADARRHATQLMCAALRGRVAVVATLRPEFVGAVQADEFLAAIPRRIVEVAPLSRRELAAVVEGPARLAGIGVEQELVHRLVVDTHSGEALPLLAFTLQQLADGVGRGGRLSSERYERLGGVSGALVSQAESAMAGALARTGRTRTDVITSLLRLVTVDEQGRPTRWRVRRDDLPEEVADELDEFVNRRLLTTDVDQGTAVVTVAHEAFLTAWPPLAEAITNAAIALRMRPQLEHAAERWHVSGRASLHLWEGTQLARAVADTGARLASSGSGGRRVRVSDQVPITATASDFLGSSIRRERRRRTRTVAVLAGLLTVAVVAAGIAIVGQQSARRQQLVAEQQRRAAEEQQRVATAHGLVAEADALRGSDLRTSMRLGIAARHFHDDQHTEAGLLRTVMGTSMAATLTADAAVDSVAWSSDGQGLATAGGAGLVLWDLAERDRPRRMGAPRNGQVGGFESVAWSSDDRTLLTTERGGRVSLWDVADREWPRRTDPPVTESAGAGPNFGVAWSPDSRTMATPGRNETADLWDVTNRNQPRRIGEGLPRHRNGNYAMAWSPNGLTLAVRTGDAIVLWDLANLGRPSRIGQYPLNQDGGFAAAWSPDSETLAVSAGGSSVVLWDLANRHRPRRIDQRLTGHTDTVSSLAWSPDGRTLATGSNDDTAILWDLTNRERPHRIGKPLTGHTDDVSSADWSPDGHTLATASQDGTVILWDKHNPSQPRREGEVAPGSGVGWEVAWSPDGRTLATTDADETMILWDLAEPGQPERIGKPVTGSDVGYDVAWAPDGRTLATVGGGQAVLWDIADRNHPRRIGRPLITSDEEPMAVAWPPDGRILAVRTSDDGVILWDVTDPRQPRPVGDPLGRDSDVQAVAWSPDGRTLAITYGNTGTELLDLTRPDQPRHISDIPLEDNGRGFDAAWSPNGNTLAIKDRSDIVLWEVADPTEPRRISKVADDSSVHATMVWSPDSRILAAVPKDNTVVLLDLTNPSRPHSMSDALDHTNAVQSLAWSTDGLTLATSDNRSLTIWETGGLRTQRDRAMARACAAAGGGLTELQWRQYIPALPYDDTCAAAR